MGDIKVDKGIGMTIGMFIGFGFGISYDIATDFFPIGIIMGLAIGTCIGLSLEHYISHNNRKLTTEQKRIGWAFGLAGVLILYTLLWRLVGMPQGTLGTISWVAATGLSALLLYELRKRLS